MKETIYTIPVNDAYAENSHCPLCTLQNGLNQQLIAYYLGPALMESDIRLTTNEKGFCRDHLLQLYHSEVNRLGLGLTLHTHIGDLSDDLLSGIEKCIPAGRKGLFSGKDKNFRSKLRQMADKIDLRTQSCMICERLDKTMDRYLDVIYYQYFIDPAFKEIFDQGNGYCLPHLSLLLRGAAHYLNQNQAAEFVASLEKLERNCMEELKADVEWYTLKFDYRNQDKSWKNSKDALPRAIRQLAGHNDIGKKE